MIPEVLIPAYLLIGIEVWLHTIAFQVSSSSVRIAAFDRDDIPHGKPGLRNIIEWHYNEGQEKYV